MGMVLCTHKAHVQWFAGFQGSFWDTGLQMPCTMPWATVQCLCGISSLRQMTSPSLKTGAKIAFCEDQYPFILVGPFITCGPLEGHQVMPSPLLPLPLCPASPVMPLPTPCPASPSFAPPHVPAAQGSQLRQGFSGSLGHSSQSGAKALACERDWTGMSKDKAGH